VYFGNYEIYRTSLGACPGEHRSARLAARPQRGLPAVRRARPAGGHPTWPGPGLKARLFAAFDLQVLWNKPGRQATVHAEITEATLRALPALLDPGQDGYDDTADIASGETADVEDLFESPKAAKMLHRSRILHKKGAAFVPRHPHAPRHYRHHRGASLRLCV
jgi:hypothetical protein